MYWALIAIKGSDEEYSFFRENEELKTLSKKENINIVSTLDNNDPEDETVLKPLHEFLRFYYPFYAKDEEYQSFKNSLTQAIVANFGDPDYMKFFFEELQITGQDGPYAIIFRGNSLTIKFLGKGPWTNYGLCQYLKNNELVPPVEWEREPQPPNSDDELNAFRANSAIDIDANTRQSLNASLGNFFKSLINFSDDDSFDEENPTPQNNQVQKFENALSKIENDISQEAIQLLEIIRNEQMQKGFQDLISVILRTSPELIKIEKNPQTQKQNLILPSVKINSGYQILFPFGELKLEPLHKALYLLFLKVPDGISLYSISDYKDTLMHLYYEVSLAEDTQKMRSSILRMVDRHDNSLYEKISRVNSIIKKELIQHGTDYATYSILGQRGQPKKVIAARDLIVWSA